MPFEGNWIFFCGKNMSCVKHVWWGSLTDWLNDLRVTTEKELH